MIYLVCHINQPPVRALTNTEYEMARASTVKSYHTSEESASKQAKKLATDTPGNQYGVMVVGQIWEALPPATPKLIHKKLNDSGEVVVAS